MATTKKPTTTKVKLYEKLTRRLGGSNEEIELRALRELDERLGAAARAEKAGEEEEAKASPAGKTAAMPAAKPVEKLGPGGLPKRLYLLLDGRGLDGRGLPVEVIDLPATLGSSKRCSVWVNSPNIETRHLQITQDGSDWVLEDLNSAGGTFLGKERISRRTIRDGEEYQLAGYLRMRTELR